MVYRNIQKTHHTSAKSRITTPDIKSVEYLPVTDQQTLGHEKSINTSQHTPLENKTSESVAEGKGNNKVKVILLSELDMESNRTHKSEKRKPNTEASSPWDEHVTLASQNLIKQTWFGIFKEPCNLFDDIRNHLIISHKVVCMELSLYVRWPLGDHQKENEVHWTETTSCHCCRKPSNPVKDLENHPTITHKVCQKGKHISSTPKGKKDEHCNKG